MNALAFGWGFAEATFFFLVPDVALMFIALRGFAAGLRASVAALAGALLGGSLMYIWGHEAPAAAEAFLKHVPAIHAALLTTVRERLAVDGVAVMFVGPLRGIPYKIYAVEWGVLHRSFLLFLLVSIPARYIRFFLSAALASALRRFLRPWMLVILWAAFYILYFRTFGW